MKLEEVLLVFKHIRQGRYQLYGNLQRMCCLIA